MARRRPAALVEFALAEAPARTVSLCAGCAHLQGTNADGTARCDAFGTIPAAVWAGRIDHRTAIEGDGGTTFAPLGAYGLSIERGFDAQMAALGALPVTMAEGDEPDPDDQDGDGEPEDDFPPGEAPEDRPNRPDTPQKESEEIESPEDEFHALLVIEGAPTGDRRFIEDGALTWRDLPLALMWQTETPEMGGHAHSVHVGQITRIERQGNEIHGWGYYLDDAADSDGARFAQHLREAGRLGVSVDMDDADVEIDWPEEEDDEEGMGFLFAEPELVRFTHARLMGATVVTFPAFAEAFVEPLDVEPDEADALVAAAIPIAPPASWFANPGLTEPTPLTITDDGRVYGHLAVWGTCHTSFQGTCVTPPHEAEMGYFTTGSLRTEEGTDVPVGQLTFGTGHAPTSLSAAEAAAHYDNTGSSAADLAAGPDDVGIWLAGALRPGTTPRQVREIRAAAVSGDWRRIGGQLRLVAALAVNVPGFPIPRTAARTAAAHQQSLVAAGIVPHRPRASLDLDAIAEHLATRVGRSRSARADELAARVGRLTEFSCGCGGKKAKPGLVSSTSTRSAVTASAAPSYEVVAPDGSRTTVTTLVEAMREARRVRGSYKVVY